MEGTQKAQIAQTGGSSRICPLIFVLRMVKWVFKFGNVSAEPRSTSRIYLGKCRVVSLSHSLLSRNGWHCLRPLPMRVAFLVDFFAFHATRTTEGKRKGERERGRERICELSREKTLRRNLLFDINTYSHTFTQFGSFSDLTSTNCPSFKCNDLTRVYDKWKAYKEQRDHFT